MRTGWQGTMQNHAEPRRTMHNHAQPCRTMHNHAEPCRYVGTFALKKLLNHNLHLDKGFVDQIRCCLCARDDREPCRTMQNHADRWGLSHLEPPKSQPTLVELRSSQIGAPTCFLVRKIDQMRYVACVHGMAGNKADRWGLSHLEPPESQLTVIESSQIGVPTCFLIRV